ncbi:nucleoside deaminase [Luteimonas dalianensis]|uniref:nucleoside deaminase n=1 Tax=Luteimonas dalianensis TaxID=1148196 RepID=UPI003BF131E4
MTGTGALPARVELTLPDWIADAVAGVGAVAGDQDKVALAIELSRRNLQAGTGGPFGAVVFGPDDRVVAAAVNRVMPGNCSLAHAEAMAYMLAQQRLGRARLNRDDDGQPLGRFVLATSSQPCCQCYGATVWAGIDRLLIGARSEDVEALTEFDEGPLPRDWVGELEKRGITVVRDLLREDARAVLRAYGESGGDRY